MDETPTIHGVNLGGTQYGITDEDTAEKLSELENFAKYLVTLNNAPAQNVNFRLDGTTLHIDVTTRTEEEV